MGSVLCFSCASPVGAAPLSDITAIFSRQTISTGTDIRLTFTTPTGISGPGQTIAVTFGSGFSLSTLTYTDVSLVHGPSGGPEIHDTVGAAASSGVWGVSVVGRVLTLTPPTDAGPGQVPVGDEMTLVLGTTAGGTHQVTTPSSAGTYEIAIAGGFGDTGAIHVPITEVSASHLGISFTIPSIGGSSAGSGGAGDPTPPPPPPPAPDPITITGLGVSDITQTTTRIAWNTSVAASCALAVSKGGAALATISTGSGTVHTVSVTGLSPGESYDASVSCSVVGSSPGSTGPVSWTTLPLAVLENVSGLRAMRDSATGSPLRLLWTLPSSFLPGDEVIVREKDTSYPWGPADGREVTVSPSGAADDPGLGTAFYAVYIRRGGAYSSGAMVTVEAVSVTPVPTPPPATEVTPPLTEVTPTRPSTPASGSRPGSEPDAGVAPSTTPAPTRPSTVSPSGRPTGGTTTLPAGGSSSSEPGAPTTTVTDLPLVIPLIPTAPEPVAPTSTPSSATISLIIPEPTSTAVGAFSVDWQWKRQDGGLALGAGSQVVRVLAGDGLQVIVKSPQSIVSGQIRVGDSIYALSRLDDRQLVVGFSPGNNTGDVDAIATVRNDRGEEKTIKTKITIVSPAQIQEKGDSPQPSDGADVQIFAKAGSKWNPLSETKKHLDGTGVYRQYLAAGTYRVEVSKAGWRTLQKTITLTSAGPVTGVFLLDKTIENPLAAIDPKATVLENAGNVAAATAVAVAQVVEDIRTPQTEAAAQVAAPVAVIATAGATAAAASSFNLLAYLRFLFTQPLLLLRRRKREKWGLVYNALTKQPIDLAIVRLLDAKTGALKQTRITDAQGRYAFLAEVGQYKLQVVKPGFVFPSATLAQEKMDVDLVDLYHGEEIGVQASATLTPNIPIDPTEKAEIPKAILRRKRIRKAQHVLGGVGLATAVGALIIQPTVLMGVFTAGQVAMFFLFRRLAIPAKPKNWGIVYDKKTRKPIGRVVVRIFDKKYNKLLETQLTDRDGKYAFFAGKNVYYVTADAPGYEHFISKELDLRNESMGVIREHLALQAKTSVSSVSAS